MARIFIDTDELRAISGSLQGDAAELADVALGLSGAWAQAIAPPIQLVGLAARGSWTQARIGTLAAQVGAASASLRVESLMVEVEETGGGLAAALGLTDAAFLAALSGFLGGGTGSRANWARWVSSRIDAVGDALVVKDSRLFLDSMEEYGAHLKRGRRAVGRKVSFVSKIAKKVKPFSLFLDGHTAITGFDDIFRDDRTDRPNWAETLQDSLDWSGSIMSLGSVGLVSIAGIMASTGVGAPLAAVTLVAAGVLGTAALATSVASLGIDAAAYLYPRAAVVWSDAREGWKVTTSYVGDATESAWSSTKEFAGDVASDVASGAKRAAGWLNPLN